MNIRTKLLGIISLICLVFLLSVSIFMFFNNRIGKIEQERAILTQLRTSLTSEGLFLNGFCFTPFSAVLENYIPFTEATDQSFADVASLAYVLKLIPSLAEQFESINAMKEHIIDRRNDLYASTEAFLVLGEQLGGSRVRLKLVDFARLMDYSKKNGFDAFLEASNKVSSSILIMNQSIGSSIAIIDEQYEVIDEEIAKYAQRSIMISILIAFILGLTGLLISVVIITRLSRRIVTMIESVKLISVGDLSAAIAFDGTDEVGSLGASMETMRENLVSAMGQIQLASASSMESRMELEGSVQDSEDALDKLNAETTEIQKASEDLDSNVRTSREAIRSITGDVANMNTMIQSQAAMVEQSTAAITEMASSITSLNSIMERNKDGSTKLINIAGIGESQLKETNENIARINRNITTIQDMADLISGIAARTNLLAMNAAIEAAHAGEFGKGFSVVADEIRKLAEASASNSKTIVKNLKEVISNIQDANASSTNTSESFRLVQNEIGNVSNNFDEIVGSLRELKEGGGQILDAMIELNNYTTNVSESVGTIIHQTGSVTTSMDAVSGSAESVSRATARIQAGLGLIHDSFLTVDRHAKTIGDISGRLDAESSKFRLGASVVPT